MAFYKICESFKCSIRWNPKTTELVRIIVDRLMLNSKHMSTASDSNRLLLHDIVNNKGILTLNRPEKLNSFIQPLTEAFLNKLIEWEKKVQMVIVKAEGKAFCSGGDIMEMTKQGPQNYHVNKAWIKLHYTMIGFIAHYPVPYVVLMDGLTMGGGITVGLDQVRIATERTFCSTPEASIGFFVDTGLSYLLSKLPHNLGLYLGLTGTRLTGTDVVKAGVATHFAKSVDIPTLLKGLIELKDPKTDLKDFLLNNTEDVSDIRFSLEPHLELIDKAFSAASVEDIFEFLRIENSSFALQTLDKLKQMSPTSLKICKKLIELYKNKTLLEGLVYDVRIGNALLEGKSTLDFYEGARARVIDKDNNPKWNPASLEKVTDDMVKELFQEVSSEEEKINFNYINELRRKLQC